MNIQTLVESLQQAGVIGILILALAFIGFTIAFVQLIYLSQFKRQFFNITENMTNNDTHVISQLRRCCLENRTSTLEGLQLKLEVIAQQQLPSLERGLSLLKLLAAIAPMLGLLGTVSGMIVTFQTMASTGSNDPAVLASGISMALITTVLGLITAMPLLMLHNITQNRSRQLIHRLEIEITRLLATHLDEQQ